MTTHLITRADGLTVAATAIARADWLAVGRHLVYDDAVIILDCMADRCEYYLTADGDLRHQGYPTGDTCAPIVLPTDPMQGESETVPSRKHPNTLPTPLASPPGFDISAMLSAYQECAEWSSTHMESEDADPVNIDSMGLEWHPDAVRKAESIISAFVAHNADDLAGMDPGQAGHDLWLTSARHGAGFWDRGLGAKGQRLTDSAHTFQMDLYVGDDGFLHLA